MNENSTDALNASRDQKLEQILAATLELVTRVEQVETRVDERLRETRPIWEAVHVQLAEIKETVQAETQSRQSQVAELQAQIGELKESQQSLRAEMEKSFRLLDRRMEMYSEMVARVHAYERDLEDRVDELTKRLG